ncbi:MAG: hypothetical protein KC910_31580, partial [Candidatus Eremiobacteraeota bacterium]|nr:hypothetical protein [Candidatus Eremiobacteraeota bacterium]
NLAYPGRWSGRPRKATCPAAQLPEIFSVRNGQSEFSVLTWSDGPKRLLKQAQHRRLIAQPGQPGDSERTSTV